MARIISVGHYLPETRVRTEDLLSEIKSEQYGISRSFVSERIGISEVRHAKSTAMPSDLAINASESALLRAGVNSIEIGVIIYCGIARDFVEPSTAHVVQNALGASNAFCFDVGNACLGFLTGLQLADNMVRLKTVDYALVCTGETGSRVSKSVISMLNNGSDMNCRNVIGAFTVGDAGAAAIVGHDDLSPGILGFNNYSQGHLAKLCYYNDTPEGVEGNMIMDKICREMLTAQSYIYKGSLEKLNWNDSDINCLITHQVGDTPFKRSVEIFNVKSEIMPKTYDYLGNIASATFGVNLSLALESKQIKPGDKVFSAMAGSGLSVGQMGMIA